MKTEYLYPTLADRSTQEEWEGGFFRYKKKNKSERNFKFPLSGWY